MWRENGRKRGREMTYGNGELPNGIMENCVLYVENQLRWIIVLSKK